MASLRVRVRQAVLRVLAEHASPGGLALAVAVGALIGCTPFYGLQTLMALGLAWVLRLNRAATVAASQISVPPLSPLIIFGAVQAGEVVLRGRPLALAVSDFRGAEALTLARSLFVSWLVGGLVVGALVGAVLGGITFVVARLRARARRPALGAARRRAAARYRRAPRRDRYYARIKYRWDPGYLHAAEALDGVGAQPEARIVDLGCGLGMLAVLLGEAGAAARITGLDWDAAKLGVAEGAARGLERLRFARADLLCDPAPECEAAALIDVLHYHPPAAQDALLARVATALAPGGRLVVRELDADGAARLAGALERLAARLGWHRTAGRFHYRSARALRATLEGLGLTVTVRPAGGFLYRGNVLLCADKPPVGAASRTG